MRGGRGGTVKKQLLASRTPLATSTKPRAPTSRGPQTVTKAGSQNSAKALPQTAVKAKPQFQASTVKNISQPREADSQVEEEITDEMLFKKYADYLNAAFINTKTQSTLFNPGLFAILCE